MPGLQEIDYIKSTLCSTEDTFWQLFNALGDCVRYRMAKVMMRYRKISVTDMAKITGISVPAASQHLKVLAAVGLVTRQKSGKTVFYELRENDIYVSKLIQVIDLWINRKES